MLMTNKNTNSNHVYIVDISKRIVIYLLKLFLTNSRYLPCGFIYETNYTNYI